MKDVIVPKRPSLRPGLIEATMFLKVNMSLMPNNPTYVTIFPIWNTLSASHPKLSYDIDNSNDNAKWEDDDLSPVLVEGEKKDYMWWF